MKLHAQHILSYNSGRGVLKGVTIFLYLSILLLHSNTTFSQTSPDYDEISITCNVQRIGSIELAALIYKDQCYLPVKDLFDFLKIKNQLSVTEDSITGFFIQPEAYFVFDKLHNRISYQQNNYDIPEKDFINVESNFYVKAVHFGNIFGLDCQFNFRSLSVSINSRYELPAIKEMQLELMRKNIIKLKGEKKADTTIGRDYSLFHLGSADWAVVSSQQKGFKPSTRVNLALGANLAGGETDIYLNYTSQQTFSKTRQFYKWKYVDNNNPVFKQLTVGKMFTQSTTSIFAPILGVQINNTPTTYRRSFGSYILSNNTEPGWTVELYVNNILVNYMQADASGFYSFEVPLVYGNSYVKLRFFGPWGEERTKEENINVPFNFLPAGQFEYNLTAGVVDDNKKGIFTRFVSNYGLNSRVTIGAGLEYLSSLRSKNAMPFVNASVRLTSNILLTAEHIDGVQNKAMINYRLKSNLQIEANYVKYVPGQQAILANYIDEKKLVVSMPFKRKRFTLFSRFSYSEIKIPKSSYTSTELLLSTSFKGISSNLTTNAFINDPQNIFIYSNLSFTFRVNTNLRITPQIQYEYSTKKLGILKCEVEKRLFQKGFINASYEHNSRNREGYAALGIRYNLSFTQASFTVQQSKKMVNTVQTARGSFLYNDQTHQLSFNNQTSIGKGGIILKAYLDVNCNGKRDANEPMLNDVNIHVNGGKLEMNKDTTISISNLEANNSYNLEMDNNNFENIAWQIKHKNITIMIDPNKFKVVEVPVLVMGEVSGNILLNSQSGKKGLSRVIVNILNEKGNVVGKTLSESDGYYSFLGLVPGKYTVQIDDAQLTKLKMQTSQANKTAFVIHENRDGDVAEGLDFMLFLNDNK